MIFEQEENSKAPLVLVPLTNADCKISVLLLSLISKWQPVKVMFEMLMLLIPFSRTYVRDGGVQFTKVSPKVPAIENLARFPTWMEELRVWTPGKRVMESRAELERRASENVMQAWE